LNVVCVCANVVCVFKPKGVNVCLYVQTHVCVSQVCGVSVCGEPSRTV